MADHGVCQRAARMIRRAEERGECITWSEAEASLRAARYLRKVRAQLPSTPAQAASLDPRAQQACRIFCRSWSKWANDELRVHCERASAALASVAQPPPTIARHRSRGAVGPICGWFPTSPRGAFSKSDWRRIAARRDA